MPRATRWIPAAVLAVAACQAPSAAPSAADPCTALLAAAPHEWSERLPPVHALGGAAGPRLVALVRARPGAPGAPAAVALLGLLGGDGVGAFLAGEVGARSPLAVEAALALGALRAPAARATLEDCAGDRLADPTLRTAAACALVRLGAAAAARPLLRAVLLAGSPAGAVPGREQGLPERPRWALERYLVQRLLQQEGQAALALELDPDASWPELERMTAKVMRWLEPR